MVEALRQKRVEKLKHLFYLAAVFCLAVALSACASEEDTAGVEGAGMQEEATPNTLTSAEQEEGWTLLFDGQSMDQWTGLGRDSIPRGHWSVEDGTIRKVESGEVPTAADGQPLAGGDIMTKQTYDDYELSFEWKVDSAANSGVKYNVSEEMSTASEPTHAALGFEYQVLDDDAHPDAEDPTHRTGALYDMIAPDTSKKQLLPVGDWNQSRIVFRGNHGEHWLNGEKVVEYDLNTPRFDSLLAASKYSDVEGFGNRRTGHIVLQDHGDNVWYRNVKIRELSSPQQANATSPAEE